jgi:lipopolysaccharide transport system permease protein
MSQPSRFWDLLYQLTLRDLKSRYKQTFLGALWVFGRPLVELGAFMLVFGAFLKAPSDGVPYPLFAFSGVVLWSFISGGIARGSRSVSAERELVATAPFPKAALPFAALGGALIDSALAALPLLALMIVQGVAPSPQVVWLAAVVPIVALLVTGISLLAATLNVFYRDFGHLVDMGLRAWLLLTPVAYAQSVVPERFRGLYELNPLVAVFDATRAALLGVRPVDPGTLAYPLAVGAVACAVGVLAFRKAEPYFAESV